LPAVSARPSTCAPGPVPSPRAGLVGQQALSVGALAGVAVVTDVVQHVVVAGQNGVRQLGRLQHLHGAVGHLPLFRLAHLVDHVAEVAQERNVERLRVRATQLVWAGYGSLP
jgi:hypothetical protein